MAGGVDVAAQAGVVELVPAGEDLPEVAGDAEAADGVEDSDEADALQARVRQDLPVLLRACLRIILALPHLPQAGPVAIPVAPEQLVGVYDVGREDSTPGDHSGQAACGERSSTVPEEVDLVAGLVILAEEPVAFADVVV